MSQKHDSEKVPLTKGEELEDVPLPPYDTLPPTQVKFQPSSGTPPRSVRRDPPMDNIYLAIVTMLFCCWPCSLVGLIRGIHAMQAHYRGDTLQSAAYNQSSKRWSIASFVCGAISTCLVLLFVCTVNAVTYGVIYGLHLYNETCTDGHCGMNN